LRSQGGRAARLEVDAAGLDQLDRRYLMCIAENYGGGPVGVETLAAALSEARDAIEDVIEPYLLQQGLIARTPRGRMLGQKAWAHLGLKAPQNLCLVFTRDCGGLSRYAATRACG